MLLGILVGMLVGSLVGTVVGIILGITLGNMVGVIVVQLYHVPLIISGQFTLLAAYALHRM